MKQVLVAGATGYLGRHVVAAFHDRGFTVRALARTPENLSAPGRFLAPAVNDLADEVFKGEITRPETLQGVCDGVDVVFSSIGITRQRDGLSFMEVDYQGNRHLLDRALAAGVTKFIFVSVFKADHLPHLAPARERFVAELKQTGLDYAILRPTSYFSDMTAYLEMARAGRVFLLGDGQHRINPIHGADLAQRCVDAVHEDSREIAVGGPASYCHADIARLAFAVWRRPVKMTKLPVGTIRLLVRLMRPFSPQCHAMANFFATVLQQDFVAPPCGSKTLGPYFAAMAAALTPATPVAGEGNRSAARSIT